jgi:hypothetical protein
MKNVLQIFLSILLVYEQTLAATGISFNDRTEEINTEMINSSRVSNLPVAGVSDFFEPEHIHLIRNKDLSQYEGKKVFFGYGLYDIEEDNCKFIPVSDSNVNENTYNAEFSHTVSYFGHTYGISNYTYTYEDCKTKAETLGGFVLDVNSISEANYLANELKDAIAPGSKAWLSAYKDDCEATVYKNARNKTQHVENFKDNILDNNDDQDYCDPYKLNVALSTDKTWSKVNYNDLFHCIIEFESENMYRPIKKCAPFWRVRRDYPNHSPSLYSKKDLEKLNQADVAIKREICLKYNNEAITALEDAEPRIVQCTSYLDRTVAPECAGNPQQDICKVDECGGYIKSACTHQKTLQVGKGYVKGELIQGGKTVEVKIKSEVKTHQFLCPASNPSATKCEEFGMVFIYPKECPGSKCTELRDCFLNAKSQTESDSCHDQFKCEKIYGGNDLPMRFGEDGQLTHLRGMCRANSLNLHSINEFGDDKLNITMSDVNPLDNNDSSLPPICTDDMVNQDCYLEFPVNTQSKMGQKCVEYEVDIAEREYGERCVDEKTFSDIRLDIALTAEDDYEDNPNCLRVDQPLDTVVDRVFDFTANLKNFFIHKVSKVYIDGESEVLMEDGDDSYIRTGAGDFGGGRTLEGGLANEQNIDLLDPNFNSDNQRNEVSPAGQDPSTPVEIDPNQVLGCNSNYDEAYELKINQLLMKDHDNNPDTPPLIDNCVQKIFKDGSIMKLVVKDSCINDVYNTTVTPAQLIETAESQCQNFLSDKGLSSFQTSYDYSKTVSTGADTCHISITSSNADSMFSEIKQINNTKTEYTLTGNTTTGETCTNQAICLDGIYNDSAFPSDLSTSICKIYVGDGMSAELEQKYNEKMNIEYQVYVPAPDPNAKDYITREDVIPTESTVQFSTEGSGLNSIIVMEDYLGGGFGYYSNHTAWSPELNSITINTTNVNNKEAFIVRDIETIWEPITHSGKYTVFTHKKKKPNLTKAGQSGAGAAVALVAMNAAYGAATATTMWGNGAMLGPWGMVAVIVIVIFLALMNKPKNMVDTDIVYDISKYVLEKRYFDPLYEPRVDEGFIISEAKIALDRPTLAGYKSSKDTAINNMINAKASQSCNQDGGSTMVQGEPGYHDAKMVYSCNYVPKKIEQCTPPENSWEEETCIMVDNPSYNALATTISNSRNEIDTLNPQISQLQPIVDSYTYAITESWLESQGLVPPDDYSISGNKIKKMLYYKGTAHTGTDEVGPHNKRLDDYKRAKINQLTIRGFRKIDTEANFIHPWEISNRNGFPGCSKWNPWCTKTQGPFIAHHKAYTVKETSNIYLGATNNLTIFLPYSGDYEFIAKDKDDNTLSTRIIKDESFLSLNGVHHLHSAQINFGLEMNLAPGIIDGSDTGACRKDLSVEWGGGVSGVYIEENDTGFHSGCSKSNDNYVEEKSMTKILIRPLNQDAYYIYELEKPMPYPNKVFATTLKQNAIRNYRCYNSDFNGCNTDEDFSSGGNN